MGTTFPTHARPLPRFSLEHFVSLEQIKDLFDNVEKWSKPESVGFSIYFGARPKIRKEPKGVVLIFVPFNYPILILMSPLVRNLVFCLGFHALLSLAPGGSDRCGERCLRQGL